ncbi:LLM class F420-dependent oxidoreductase [Sphaerisporangium aureirubrum]|uniref:LLM class F420-dependent oxidoreductase n=1 Tax=Sphaerisporangium aureirubrum TaxID=1544736 RepID=A0ABW1NUR4_9ACTN
MTSPALGEIGVWRAGAALTPDLAASLERLGYGALWVGGSPSGDLEVVEGMLGATSKLTVATGIVNIWTAEARTVATSFHRIERAVPGRFLLGVGAGHPEATEEFTKPYDALRRYLDVLDESGVPRDRRMLAALGPKVMRLAGERSAGAHPYLTTPEHTRRAREILGHGPLLAPEQKVVLSEDPVAARELARRTLRLYLGLRNYTANLRRLGFTDDDLAAPGSDRLVDALVMHGPPAAVRHGVRAHLAAGADHVAVQILHAPDADPTTDYRTLADILFG